MPGILAWAVRGCLEWQSAGLFTRAVVAQETTALFETMDPLADFLEEECVLHPRAQVESSALWRGYCAFCDREERPQAFKTREWFTRNLAQRDGIEVLRRHDGRYLVGLGLRAEAPGSVRGRARVAMCRQNGTLQVFLSRRVIWRENLKIPKWRHVATRGGAERPGQAQLTERKGYRKEAKRQCKTVTETHISSR